MTETSDDKRDFFVSFNQVDRTWATWIAWVLEEKGYSVFFQDWDFSGSFIEQMHQASQRAGRTLVVLSDHYLGSEYARSEAWAALARDPVGREDRVVAVKVGPTTGNLGLFSQFAYLDLTTCAEADAERLLFERARKAVEPDYRAKPSTRPGFPGGGGRKVPDKPLFPGKYRSMAQGNSPDTPPSVSRPSLAIGVDVGTTKIAAGLIEIPETGDPTVKHYKRLNHDDIGQETQLLDRIEGAIWDVMKDAGIGKKALDYVGVGLPGQVNYDAGCMTFAPGLKLRDIPVAGELRRKLDIPVFIDNDVNCSTIAELHFGKAGAIYKDFVCIFIGTGIGAGIVINKRLFRGHGFSAGEIGHMKIDCGDGARVCTCGGTGCFEEYASARAIIRLAREKIFEVRERKETSVLSNLSPESVRPEDIVKAIKRNDKAAIGLAESVAHYLAIGIANILNMLNPQVVVLGGGIIEGLYCGCDSFRNAVSAGIKKAALDVCCNTGILTSTWGKNTPLIGAAALGQCRI